mgnify:CR=1 FL=1
MGRVLVVRLLVVALGVNKQGGFQVVVADSTTASVTVQFLPAATAGCPGGHLSSPRFE